MAKERQSVEKTNRHFIFFVEEQNENNVFEGNKQTNISDIEFQRDIKVR